MPLPLTLVIQRVILLVIPGSSFVQLNQGGRLIFGRFSAMFDNLRFVSGLQHRLPVQKRQTNQFVTCLNPSPLREGWGEGLSASCQAPSSNPSQRSLSEKSDFSV